MRIFVFIIFFLPLSLLSQDSFPDSWLGIWQGELKFYPEREQDTIKVQLEISKTEIAGTYIWRTSYEAPKLNLVKDYLLRERDASTGSFEIDEQDGIILPSRYFDDELWSLLEVDGTILIGLYSLRNGVLTVTFPSGKTDQAELSGIQDDENPVVVKSYPIAASQKIVLTRVSQK